MKYFSVKFGRRPCRVNGDTAALFPRQQMKETMKDKQKKWRAKKKTRKLKKLLYHICSHCWYHWWWERSSYCLQCLSEPKKKVIISFYWFEIFSQIWIFHLKKYWQIVILSCDTELSSHFSLILYTVVVFNTNACFCFQYLLKTSIW